MSNNKRISDKTSLNISLPMIIQVVGIISAMVWGYSQLTTRMAFVENEANRNTQAIQEIKSLQDAPIPSDIRQDVLLEKLEKISSCINRWWRGNCSYIKSSLSPKFHENK